MNSFDSLTLKYFYDENVEFIENSVLQKIQLPSRYEIILNLRNISKSENRKLYININPKYPHICFINQETSKKRDIKIPKAPPMFCMQLRKYLSGSKIKGFKIVQYERILELYFDYFDEIGSLTSLCLALEFMGKHSNIILYNAKNKIITGSIHNISEDKSSVREIYGGIKYVYPPIKNKLDILNVSYSTFYEIAKNKDIAEISNNFYYFSRPLLECIFSKFDNLEDIFEFMQNLESLKNKDFISSYWNGVHSVSNSIDNYFSNIMFEEILNQKKQKLKKYLQKEYKKLSKITKNIPDDTKMQKYKTYGDLIMSNLYFIEAKSNKIEIENNIIEIDENISLSDNAQKYYNLYKKAKGEYEHLVQRFNESKDKFQYFETILLNIDLANSYDEIDEIKEELVKIGVITQNTKASNKINKETKIKFVEYNGFKIYIGKNNIQNDFLISKIASPSDLWFHGLNFPSSHVVLKMRNDKKPDSKTLEYCASLVKQNSKAKTSGKTSIIMTERKNLRKPPNTYLGYVTYKNETEIVIE